MRSAGAIVVVGSTMIDMIAYTDRAPGAGETVIGQRFVTGFGGKGANQAATAKRFGATVHMVNTVGTDSFGTETIANFQSLGIDTTHISRADGASGVAPIWVEPDGTNRIIVIPGANNAMTAEQTANAINSIDNIAVVIGQLEIPQPATTAAFKAAKQRGAITILNPAPFAPVDQALLEVTDWLVPNEHEFAGLHPTNAAPDAHTIQELNTTARLLVTLGEHGAIFQTRDGGITHIPAPTVNAIDTTGAGDCFVGAFAYALANNATDEQAVQLGINAASLSVTRSGTQTSLPTPEEAQRVAQEVGI